MLTPPIAQRHSWHGSTALQPCPVAPLPAHPLARNHTLPLLACLPASADLADSLRGLEAGMRNLQQEYDFELEQQRIKSSAAAAAAAAAAASASSTGDDGGGSRGSSPKAPADRQAAFNTELQAAAGAAAAAAAAQRAGASSGYSGSSAAGAPAAATTAVPAAAPLPPPFAAMLGGFLESAARRQAELDAASRQTSAVVKETVTWLGEAAGDQEAAVFELLFNFAASFDLSCKQVHRKVLAAAATAAGPANGGADGAPPRRLGHAAPQHG